MACRSSELKNLGIKKTFSSENHLVRLISPQADQDIKVVICTHELVAGDLIKKTILDDCLLNVFVPIAKYICPGCKF